MRALILANGDPPSRELFSRLRVTHDLLIATDGAAHRAVELQQTPDIISGDFDSIDLPFAEVQFPEAQFLRTPDQDHADLEKALQIAFERGAKHVTVAGALGGRIDHALANCSLLISHPYGCPGRSVSFIGDTSGLIAVSPESGALTLPSIVGETISVISFAGEARVTISGVRWPLESYLLPPGTRGVSNISIARNVNLIIQNGIVLVARLLSTDSAGILTIADHSGESDLDPIWIGAISGFQK